MSRKLRKMKLQEWVSPQQRIKNNWENASFKEYTAENFMDTSLITHYLRNQIPVKTLYFILIKS